MGREKRGDDVLVLGPEEAAGRVDQRTPRPDERLDGIEDRALASGEILEVPRPEPPADLRVRAERSHPGAGGVDERGIEDRAAEGGTTGVRPGEER
jgi:hypothetical protein